MGLAGPWARSEKGMAKKKKTQPPPRRTREGQVLLGLIGLMVAGVVFSTLWVQLNPPPPTPTPTPAVLSSLPQCAVPNLTWSVPGWLLRGGAPAHLAIFDCKTVADLVRLRPKPRLYRYTALCPPIPNTVRHA